MNTFTVDQLDHNALQQLQAELQDTFKNPQSTGLSLDLTRGKPSSEQLSLSNPLDGILKGTFTDSSGTDTRNYGGLDGLNDAKTLAAQVLNVDTTDVLIGGNSSLTLMYQSILFAHVFGLEGEGSAWQDEDTVKFLCPVPGYDRHFSICEDFGIEMINVPMDENGPIMDVVEKLIAEDASIKGIWCVPRFSNPTGITYSDDVVDRIAKLGNIAAANFRVFWDNAYAIHHIENDAPPIKCLLSAARDTNCEDSVLMFGSTSKVTFAGAGMAYMAASAKNLAAYKTHLGIASIGPDKINQLRHVAFFQNFDGLMAHMDKHAELLKPRFNAVLSALESNFKSGEVLTWTTPKGGYFVSVDTQPGLAATVVSMAADLGVKLTPAGATFPYGNDPQDCNIRLAPSFPTVEDISKAMEIFVLCVKLATVNAALSA